MAGQTETQVRSAERLKFFTDAVVAIAMTLLILPLLESVSDAAGEGDNTVEWVRGHHDQLLSFALSFVIIAAFWVGHERLFDVVAGWSGPLMLLNIAWMFTIVFLPVATALVGSIETDRAQLAIYIGTMLLSSLVMWGMHLVVRRDPRTWEGDSGPTMGAVTAQAASAVLFAIALVAALVIPGVSYFAMFLLFLTGTVQSLLSRVWHD